MEYITKNKDDIMEAVHGLDIFTKNFCMNVKETNEKDDLIFRCNECIFSVKDTNICLIHQFAHDNMHGYDMNEFGSMSR